MVFEVDILDTKDYGSNVWFLCKGDLIEYLEKLKPSFYEYIIQRKIVKNRYLNTLVNTVQANEPLPIITLTTTTKLDNVVIGKSTKIEMADVEILDGLQRTFRLWAYYKIITEYENSPDLSPIDFAKKIKNKYPEFFDSAIINLTKIKEYYKDDTFQKIKTSFSTFEIYFFVWSGLSPQKVIHKMLVLNAGQRPVSLTHQYELLFLYVWEELKNNSGVKLYRDRDPSANKIKLGERKAGEYMFTSVIAGLRSYIENKPKKISIDDLDIEDLQQGESGIQINENIFTKPFIQTFLDHLKKIDELVSEKEGNEGLKWFVRDTTISGLLAGLGKFAEVKEDMNIRDIETSTISAFNHLAEKVSNPGFNLPSFQHEYYNLQSKTVNVGTYVRSIIMDYTLQMLNGGSPDWHVLFSKSKS